MSNISRRDFLKTAGVMTLAVAAAGVLAGCDNTPAVDPDAGKPEVTTNSVAYTDMNGNKMTIESLGRFNVYDNHDAEEVTKSQSVLKVTLTKPEYSTALFLTAGEIPVYSKNGATKLNAITIDKVDARLVQKFGLKDTNLITDLESTGLDTAIANSVKVEKYIVLAVKGVATNDLQVGVSYANEDGEAKFMTMPLTVTATDLY